MSKRPLIIEKGLSLLFNTPNIQGKTYRPGRQPYNPGESQMDSGFPYFMPIPWPNAVGTLPTLANFGGIAVGRPIGVTNNSEAPLLANYLFLSGVAEKSRG